MKNLKNILIPLLMAVVTATATAQNVSYTNDAAGNRIKREIVMRRNVAPTFLLTVGEPSLWNSAFGSKHDLQSYERDANYRAFKYFNKNLRKFSSSNWYFYENPLTRSRYDLIDYNNPNDLKRVEHSLQKFYLFF